MTFKTLQDGGRQYRDDLASFAHLAECVREYIATRGGRQDRYEVPGLEGFEGFPRGFRFRLFGEAYSVRLVYPLGELSPTETPGGSVTVYHVDHFDPTRATAVATILLDRWRDAATPRPPAGGFDGFEQMTAEARAGLFAILALIPQKP